MRDRLLVATCLLPLLLIACKGREKPTDPAALIWMSPGTYT